MLQDSRVSLGTCLVLTGHNRPPSLSAKRAAVQFRTLKAVLTPPNLTRLHRDVTLPSLTPLTSFAIWINVAIWGQGVGRC